MQTRLSSQDEATRYHKLLDFLRTKESQEYQEMLKVVPWPDSQGYQASKDWFQPRLHLLNEILHWIERLEAGEKDPNAGTDFLHADGTVPERLIWRNRDE